MLLLLLLPTSSNKGKYIHFSHLPLTMFFFAETCWPCDRMVPSYFFWKNLFPGCICSLFPRVLFSGYNFKRISALLSQVHGGDTLAEMNLYLIHRDIRNLTCCFSCLDVCLLHTLAAVCCSSVKYLPVYTHTLFWFSCFKVNC